MPTSKRNPSKGGAGVPKRARHVRRRAAPAPKSRALARIERPSVAEAIERVLIQGDLSNLTPEQRLEYYNAVCKSVGLNPLTRPFEYLFFQETENSPRKLSLYARKDCTEQLRKLHSVAILDMDNKIADGVCIVKVMVRDRTGRTDVGTGAVALYKFKDGSRINLSGKEFCNAVMKAETKAKRRATLSICGLGFLDESELDGIEQAHLVTPGGRVIHEMGERGTVEAAQAVAQRKIAEHAAKTAPRPSQAQAKQESVEFTPWKEGCVALTGHGLTILGSEIEGGISSFATWAENEKVWFIPGEHLADVKNLCTKYGVHPIERQAPAQAKPTPTSPDGKGIIKSTKLLEGEKNGKKWQMLSVKWGTIDCGTFDKNMWPFLSSGVGKLAALDVEKNAKGRYAIRAILSIGQDEFEVVDGKTVKVLQRQ